MQSLEQLCTKCSAKDGQAHYQYNVHTAGVAGRGGSKNIRQAIREHVNFNQ